MYDVRERIQTIKDSHRADLRREFTLLVKHL